jgi:hypothetical protein
MINQLGTRLSKPILVSTLLPCLTLRLRVLLEAATQSFVCLYIMIFTVIYLCIIMAIHV